MFLHAKKKSIWSVFYDPEKPSFTKSPQLMNNSYFVCDVAPMKLCYPPRTTVDRVYCMHLLLHNNVEKKLHKNFMPLLTHENACIIYTEVTWRLLFTLGCSWVQVRWYYIVDFIVDFQWVFCQEPVQGGVSFCRSNCNKIIKRKTWPQQ